MTNMDWSLIRAFLATAETGSLSAAARQLGLSQPTLGRQVKAAEAWLGVPLFERHAKGLRPTPEGEALLPSAAAMRDAAARFEMAAAGRDEALSGVVRISASLVMSHYVLPPVLARIRMAEPLIQIELEATDSTRNLLFREADIAVRMYRPTQLDVIARKAGTIELGLFASKSYLRRNGVPGNADDLLRHQMVGYDRSEMILDGMRDLGLAVDRGSFAVRCDNQTVYWQLVRAGCGIGVGQKSLGESDPGLRQVLPDAALPELPVWLTAHEALRNTPRIRRVYDLLVEALAS